MSQLYDEKFYKKQQGGSFASASGVIPTLFKIFKPESVIDIGCGVGTWLKVFKEQYHVKNVLGVDGEYVDKQMLQIDKNEFVSYNLEKTFTAPRKFDLSMSVEVGEHLPDSAADNLVQSLTDASDVVMFSAAIPGQTGTYHINEQYPEYWAKKFGAKGYVCIDHIRKQIWTNTEIDFWYRQNILLFVKKEAFENRFQEILGDSKAKTDPEFLTRIHPEMLHYYIGKFYQTRSLTGFIRFHLYPLKKLIKGKK